MRQGHLVDRFNRIATNLRVSVTDICNLRCTYCMSEDMQFIDESKIMTFDEIEQLIRVAVSLGVDKVRITGGEPLVRRGLSDLISKVIKIDGIKDVSLTTNGIGLAKQAQALYDVGLRRINVSLDTLSKAKFQQITRREALAKVLEGLEEAKRCGFDPIKINAVVQKGINDNTLVELASWCRDNGYTPRFIEYMDVGTLNDWKLDEVLPASEIVKIIEGEFSVTPIESSYRGEVAKRYRYKDGKGEFGVISSVTQPFCGDCTRLRLSPEGQIVTCLFADGGTDLRGPMRSNIPDEELLNIMSGTWSNREDRYSEIRTSMTSPRKKVEMYHIGG